MINKMSLAMINTFLHFCSIWQHEWGWRHGVCDGILRVWYVQSSTYICSIIWFAYLMSLYYKITIWVVLNELSLFLPGKKARTFDLDAIFEQTRRTAIERSQRVLGMFTNMTSCLFHHQGVCNCVYCHCCFLRWAGEGWSDGGGRRELQIRQATSPCSERQSCSSCFQVTRDF